MDAKTPPPPPIPLKLPEKARAKKHERLADVSLPPLTSRQNEKTVINSWTRRSTNPTCYQNHNNNKKRPYRVLQIGATPLMHACQQADRSRVLRLLREQEESIGYRDRTLRSALHYCMDAGTGGAVASAAPELVNAPDAEGHTPLHLAVIAGDTQLVAVLLANGADVNAKDLEGHSVLHWATVCGEAECVRLILAAGARPSTADLRGGSPLHYAAQCCGAATNAAVLAVPKKLGLKILRTLLEFGADVNAKDEDGRQPILWAASAGSTEAVLALARAGGAAAAGASDKDGLTALHCAASRGHVGCIEALVNLCGSQPDHVDDNGCSALHYAATLGHADATSLILRLGADPNRQDRKGRTPALCAAAKGQLETLKILAQHGGSLHARTVRGTGVAHEAVTSGRIELLEWLIKKRPSILDVATQDGKTPLHVAALHGHLDACKMLLDHGARINAILRTSKGNAMTALDAALYRGHRDCAKLIQMHGGTTAQRLKIHKIVPNKVFSAKLWVKRTAESSTDVESGSPRRRGHDYGYGRGSPRVYYEEERWTERRTHRRENSKTLSRRDSRSYSEEEIRSSKASFRKERQRRARSESARYDDFEEDSCTDERSTRKGRKKRKARSKGDYSESFVEYTDESSQENAEEKEENETVKRTHLRRKYERRRRSKCRARKSNRSEIGVRGSRADCSRWKTRNVKDEHSGSDDSLEAIVVRTSDEKMRENVGEGKPRGSREEPDSIVRTRKRATEGKASKSPGSTMVSTDKVKVAAPRGKTTLNDVTESLEKKREKEARYDVAEDAEDIAPFVRGRYHRDATDSTSHETVERVLVTAMVHKDGQGPDTPKSTTTREIPKEVGVSGDTSEKKTTSEIIHPIYKVDDECGKSSGVDDDSKIGLKALDPRDVENSKGGETKVGEDEIAKEGRLRVLQVKESRGTSVDSTTNGGTECDKDSLSSKNKEKDDGQSDDASATNTLQRIVTTASIDGGSIPGTDTQKDNSLQSPERSKPATPLEDIVVAATKTRDDDEKMVAVDATTATTKKDVMEDGNVVDTEKDVALEESLTEHVIQETLADRKLVDEFDSKEGPPEASEFASETSSLLLTARVSDDDNDDDDDDGNDDKDDDNANFEDKEQVDSARGKSVDLSSDSRDSASAMRGGGDGSSSLDTPLSAKDRLSEERSTDVRKETRRRQSQEILQTDATAADSFANNDDRIISSKDDARTRSASPRRSKWSRRYRSKNTDALVDPEIDAAKKGSLASLKSMKKKNKRLLNDEKSGERSTDRCAIVAVIEGPGWEDEEENEEIEEEIRKAIGEDLERDTEAEESNNEAGVVRVLPSTTSEEESRRRDNGFFATLPQVKDRPCTHSTKTHSPPEERRLGLRHRRGSSGGGGGDGGGGGGGRDSGIEPSPRVSRIPKRKFFINYPNVEKHEALDIRDTVTRDVQISMRRYHLERKIFFQLMELKRLQIRHGRANEQVLIKRQVESFHKAGMSGPTLGVAKYDQPLTFRHFEAFLYEQLRKLQRRPTTPNFCRDAKHCTRRTHRCHHATTAYTSVPVYTYLGGDVQERGDVFPKIETRGKGRMTVEVSHGDEKQVVALPAERLDRTKRYFVTFTVTGTEHQGITTTTTMTSTTTTTTTTKPISPHSTKKSAAKSI